MHTAEEGRTPRHLDEIDYLLGVSDNTRQGALRFHPVGGTFTGEPSTVPPLISLPHLMRLSESIVSGDNPQAAVKALLDTGTTALGGARPKASVVLDDGALGIAKFPHASDKWDVLAWEAVALATLRNCGVLVPVFDLVRVDERSVLLSRRFDRDDTGARLPYFSAMTAVGGQDASHYDYAEITDAIRDISCRPAQDLAALFDRVVVNVALGNTDDHLRNQGFVWTRDGWRLAPAFDVNPNPYVGSRRSTSIMGADTIHNEAAALLDFAVLCDLSRPQAEARVAELVQESAVWERHARKYGIRAKEIIMMGEMFEARRDALLQAIHPRA